METILGIEHVHGPCTFGHQIMWPGCHKAHILVAVLRPFSDYLVLKSQSANQGISGWRYKSILLYSRSMYDGRVEYKVGMHIYSNRRGGHGGVTCGEAFKYIVPERHYAGCEM